MFYDEDDDWEFTFTPDTSFGEKSETLKQNSPYHTQEDYDYDDEFIWTNFGDW